MKTKTFIYLCVGFIFMTFASFQARLNSGELKNNSQAGLNNFNYTLAWNTFMGSEINDYGKHVVVDKDGNCYMTGHTRESWGTPINNHAGGNDCFAAKFNSSGELLWNTFLGSSGNDSGDDIAVDTNGNVYVTGTSYRVWGSPINEFMGDNMEVFAAKLTTDGELEWNTFLGSYTDDQTESITVDKSGNVFVAANSDANWGSPINLHAEGTSYDAFVAKLNNDGELQWHTFMGGNERDWCESVRVDESGFIYVMGDCDATWGLPVNPFNEKRDAFVVKLNSSGVREWHTFLGSSEDDWGLCVAILDDGSVYATGSSWETWGTPVEEFGGGFGDAFAAKLNSDGEIVWNTFIGGLYDDWAKGIVVDPRGNVYVTGYCNNTWGSPVEPFHEGIEHDIYCVKLNDSGNIEWNTFFGSSTNDLGKSISLDEHGNIYISGHSSNTWGNPVTPHKGGEDAFILKLEQKYRTIGYEILVSECAEIGSNKIISKGEIIEGESFQFPQLSISDEYEFLYPNYNLLEGIEIGFPFTGLNENILFKINLNNLCDSLLSNDNLSTENIIELFFLDINIIGDVSGDHNVLDYYYFENDKEAYIKIPLSNLEYLQEFIEFDINSLVPFFTNNELSPDFEGIRKEITDDYFIIYTKHFSGINFGIPVDPTSIEDVFVDLPTEYALYQNYPNPFNPVTTINYIIPSVIASQAKQSNEITSVNSLPRNDNVSLKVYDVLGREIKTLVNEPKQAGRYSVSFDASNLSSGIYYYQLKAGSFIETQKMVLMK